MKMNQKEIELIDRIQKIEKDITRVCKDCSKYFKVEMGWSEVRELPDKVNMFEYND